MNVALAAAACGLDLLCGDPRGWPHPVVWIGRLIGTLEGLCTGLCGRTYLAGLLLTAATLTVTGLCGWAALAGAAALHPWLGVALALWLAYTCLALRALHVESRAVATCLAADNLAGARAALALIVGRDTAALDEQGILRATVETVAENTSDGILAPLCYLLAGGPLAALLYKAASTLDSMVGYRNARYAEVGWASARLDDLLNWLPARLTALLLVLAAALLRRDAAGAWRCVRRDARKHKSPNAGYPEAAVAGALGITLGGAAVYGGLAVDKATLGDGSRALTLADYRATVQLMYLAALLALAGGIAGAATLQAVLR